MALMHKEMNKFLSMKKTNDIEHLMTEENITLEDEKLKTIRGHLMGYLLFSSNRSGLP